MSRKTQPEGAMPTRVGKYQVLERLGAGGMAEVFLARQPGMAGFTKTVVIKRLRPQFAADERYVRLFIEEAKLAAQVQHKNVVQIFELGSEGGGAVFMAMEYVTGSDLKSLQVRARRQGRRFPVWLTLHAACEVLEALCFAYEYRDDEGRARRIVHNDVSPENVFFARHGEVKLGDFGVALDATRETDPFPDGLAGKLPYMAPERIAGGRCTHASDVYAVGVVLWECLCERRLFPNGERDDLAKRILAGTDVPPSRFFDDISPGLDRIVLQALSVDPARRPASARMLQIALLDELAWAGHRIGLEQVREEVGRLLGGSEEVEAVPIVPTMPDSQVSRDLISQPDFQRMLSDVMTDVVSTSGTLPDLPAELVAAFAPGTWPDTPFVPPPPGAEDGHDDDPETTAIVRARIRPRSNVAVRAEPTPAAAAPAGPRPSVWVRSRGGVQIGPRDPLEALGVLEELGSDEARRALEITTDQVEWLPVLRLPELLGEAHVSSDPTLPGGEQVGSFQTKSPTAVLAEIARSGANGRLVFVRYETTTAERTEFQIEMGHVVGFGGSRLLLPGWGLLLEDPGEVADDVVHALAKVISTRRSLADVAHAATREHLLDGRRIALERALTDVHAWPWGRYGFEPGGRLRGGRVTAMPLFPLLAGMLAEAKTVPVLMAHLTGAVDVPMHRSGSFDREARELDLGIDDQARLDRFGFGRSLRDSFAASTSLRDEGPSVRLGYLLREIGLLLPEGD